MLNVVINPILDLLVFLYSNLGNNFGLAVIALTVLVRSVLLPVTLPALKSAKKMQKVKPKLDRLKKKHKDPDKLKAAQLELYRQEGINPLGGCLPQILQLIILIALYRAFITFIDKGDINGIPINMDFLWLNLSDPDPRYILPILAGLSQFVYALMMRTGLESHVKSPKNKVKKKKEENSLDMAQSMQQQMVYLMPAMTVIIALRFPSGLALYWVTTTLYSLGTQLVVSGPGGLLTMITTLRARFTSSTI